MGQLTNQYVSSSYQGLLKMTDSTTGVTGTLQTVQTGDGTNTPLQISKTEVNISGSLTVNGAPISFDTGSFATTGSNVFKGKQTITGSNGSLTYDGTILPDSSLASIHANDDQPWLERFYNDTFSPTNSVMSYFAWNDGRFIFHNESTSSIAISTNGFSNDNLVIGDTNTTSNNDLIVSGNVDMTGQITWSGNAFNSTTLPSGALYFSSLNNGTLHLNDDGGEGDIYIGYGPNNTHIKGDVDITGSLYSTNIIGTGSLLLQPNQTDARYLEVYNTSPTDTHITASGGQVFLGDDQTYVKVDNYGSVERIDVVAGNELNVSSSIVNLTGSLHQSGTFYPDVIDWVSSSIVQSTGSYILTTNISGVTEYDSYQNVASALQPFINTGSFNRDGLITTGSAGGNQSITGSLDISGTLTALSASITYLETVYETASIIYSSGSNQFGDASNDTQTLWGTVNLPSGPLVVTGSVTATNFTGSLQGTASYATNALSASYAPDTTNTGSFMITGSVSGATSTFTKGDGSTFNLTVNNVQSSSYANNATTASYALNAGTASFVNSAVTSSIAFDLVVNGKCDNPGGLTKGTIVRITGANGDNPLFNSASWTNDPTSANTLGMLTADVAYNGFANVVVQGTVIGINTQGMTAGDLLFLSSSGQYTTSSVPAPYHEVRLGQVLRPQLNNGSAYISVDNGYELTELHDVDIQSVVVGDVLTYVSGSYGQWVNKTVDELGYLQTSSFNTYTASIDARTGSYITTGSAASVQSITGSLILSGSAGIELDVKGDQNITGSLNVSGSLNVVGPVGLNLLQPNNFKQNLTLLGGINHFTSSTVLNNYLNSITTSLNNSDNNFVLPPGAGISSAFGISILTGSVFISGSNNLILNLGSNTAASAGRKQIFGSANIGITAPNINTSSLTVPQINNNYNAGALTLTLTTGSSAGNNAHSFGSNINLSNITWNHPSASIGAGASSTVTSNVNVGTVTSTTTGPTILTAASTLSNNIISNASVSLNNISSSIQSSNNIIGGNTITFNNRYYTTGSNNFLANSSNIFAGQALTITAAGAPSTNVSRTLVGNIIGGQTINVSLEANNTDNGGLRNSLVYGQGLNITGSHSAASTDLNSMTLLGRWNGEDNGLADSARTVFAVGTGTATGTRRTSLYVTSGSLVGISGSAVITGSVQGNVLPLTVASNTASLNLNNGNFFVLALTGSLDIRIEPSNIKPGQTVNLKLNTTGSGTVSFPTSVLQQSGSAYVPTTTVGTDIITMVSFDSTNLFLANVKNLI